MIGSDSEDVVGIGTPSVGCPCPDHRLAGAADAGASCHFAYPGERDVLAAIARASIVPFTEEEDQALDEADASGYMTHEEFVGSSPLLARLATLPPGRPATPRQRAALDQTKAERAAGVFGCSTELLAVQSMSTEPDAERAAVEEKFAREDAARDKFGGKPGKVDVTYGEIGGRWGFFVSTAPEDADGLEVRISSPHLEGEAVCRVDRGAICSRAKRTTEDSFAWPEEVGVSQDMVRLNSFGRGQRR